MYILQFDTQYRYAVPMWHVMHMYITYLTFHIPTYITYLVFGIYTSYWFDTEYAYAVPIWHVMQIYKTYLTFDTHIYHLSDIWYIYKLLVWHSVYICSTYLTCDLCILHLINTCVTYLTFYTYVYHLCFVTGNRYRNAGYGQVIFFSCTCIYTRTHLQIEWFVSRQFNFPQKKCSSVAVKNAWNVVTLHGQAHPASFFRS